MNVCLFVRLFICLNKYLCVCVFVHLNKYTNAQKNKCTNTHSIIPFVVYADKSMLSGFIKPFSAYGQYTIHGLKASLRNTSMWCISVISTRAEDDRAYLNAFVFRMIVTQDALLASPITLWKVNILQYLVNL